VAAQCSLCIAQQTSPTSQTTHTCGTHPFLTARAEPPLTACVQVLWLYSRRLVNQSLTAQPAALPKCSDLHPPVECAEDCSGLGLCVAGVCVCPAGFGGPTCGVAQCPGTCSGHGLCLQDHSCLCSRVRPPPRFGKGGVIEGRVCSSLLRWVGSHQY